MAGSKTMIAPGARDAPKFSSRRPEELRCFLRNMEDLWKDAGIVNDAEKKDSIGKYADAESEEEWTAFETFEAGHTWEEFKNELIENYPEAAAAERGTPARIKQICFETQGIRLGDVKALYALCRAFMAEAKKLVKLPAVMSNRELVELFISCLSEQMAAAVLQALGNIAVQGNAKAAPLAQAAGVATASARAASNTVSRRPEDKYDLEEVMKAAIQVSENSQGMFYLLSNYTKEPADVLMQNQPASDGRVLAQKLEQLEGTQALEKDRLVTVNKNIDSKFNELESMMKALLAQTQASAKVGVDNSKPYDSSSGVILGQPGTIPKWGKAANQQPGRQGCFYCGRKDHYVPECDEVQEDLRAGLIKMTPDGKLRLKDGSQIPSSPFGATIRERVQKYYAKLQQVFCFGDYEMEDDLIGPSAPRYTAQYANMAESAEAHRARLEYELDLKEK